MGITGVSTEGSRRQGVLGGAVELQQQEGPRVWYGGTEQYGSPRECHAALGQVALQCQESGLFLTSRQNTLLRSSLKLLEAGKEKRTSVCFLGCLV